MKKSVATVPPLIRIVLPAVLAAAGTTIPGGGMQSRSVSRSTRRSEPAAATAPAAETRPAPQALFAFAAPSPKKAVKQAGRETKSERLLDRKLWVMPAGRGFAASRSSGALLSRLSEGAGLLGKPGLAAMCVTFSANSSRCASGLNAGAPCYVDGQCPDNTAPVFTTAGMASFSVVGNSTNNDISSYLAVTDPNNGQTLTYSVYIPANHGGSITNTGATATVSSGSGTPTGWKYTPANGYIGTETFTIKVVDGFGGTATRAFSVTVTAPAPSAFTGSANIITSTGATLNGLINGNGASTTVSFEYGTTAGYGSLATAAQSPVTGSSNTAVSAAISGLTCGTGYHFRVDGTNSGGTTNGSDATFTTSSCNAAPVASAVAITGTAKVGVLLSGGYTYSDANGDTQGSSTFRWVSNTVGTGIAGGTNVAATQNYTPVSGDQGKYLYFCVTPVATSGTLTGSEVCSSATAAVAVAEAAPVASAVAITGTAKVGVLLSGGYTYSDANGDTQGTSTFRWVSNTVGTGIAGGTNVATTQNYTPVSGDQGKYLYFCVTPVATSGTLTGSEVCSSATAAVAVANTAPSFVAVGAGSLTVAQAASATDIKSLLHVNDTDASQTETWSQSVAPSHGTLNFTSATASSGSTDITPGGTITYTPTASYVGSDAFTVQVSDGTAAATRVINVTVGSANTVTVNALTLNSMTVGTLFSSQSFSGAGGYGAYTYSVSAGALPAGLSLNTSTGALTGTPTTAGAYSFTIRAKDASTGNGPYSGTRAFSGSVSVVDSAGTNPFTTRTPPPVIPGVSGLPSVVDMGSGSAPAISSCLMDTLRQTLGGDAVYHGQSASGEVRVSWNGQIISFYPLAANTTDARSTGLHSQSTNPLDVVTGCGTLNVTPALFNPAGLGAFLAGMGTTAQIDQQGVITALFNGSYYVVRPDFMVTTGTQGGPSLGFGLDGLLRFTDANGNTQILRPAVLDPGALQTQVGLMGGSMVVQLDGTVLVAFANGQQYVLTPDLTLGDIPSQFANQYEWQDGPIHYRYRIMISPYAASSQGMGVSAKP